MLTYADVCYFEPRKLSRRDNSTLEVHASRRMLTLTYAHVCSRMLTYAHVCRWVTNAIRRAALDNFWLEKCPQLMERQWPLGAQFTCFTGTKYKY